MDDTSPQAEERYYDLLRQRSPIDRLNIAISLTRSVRELALASIAQEAPNATTTEQRMRLANRIYGSEIAHRVFRADKASP